MEKRSRRKVVDSASYIVQAVGVAVEGDVDHVIKDTLPSVACPVLEGVGNGNRDDEVVDFVMKVDMDNGAETPALSAPGSSSSSPLSSVTSSAASSVSDASSEVDVDLDVESQVDVTLKPDDKSNSFHPLPTVPSSLPGSSKAKQKYMHMNLHHSVVGVGTKPLTRRQRKILGLPKLKKGVPSLDEVGEMTGESAGKIVIPGGKWKGKAEQSRMMTASTVLGIPEREGEWARNGTGRLDVRGFRELKI